MARIYPILSDEDFFWERVLPEPNTGCWFWTGRSTVAGYGQLRKKYAHRFSFELHHRKLELDEHALHKCDNPCCVNPDHLFAGSHADNMRDMASKGRVPYRKGESAPRAILKEDQVRSIRADTRSYSQLAKAYGVNRSTICHLKTYRSWRHI